MVQGKTQWPRLLDVASHEDLPHLFGLLGCYAQHQAVIIALSQLLDDHFEIGFAIGPHTSAYNLFIDIVDGL